MMQAPTQRDWATKRAIVAASYRIDIVDLNGKGTHDRLNFGERDEVNRLE
jgi:hypothetical protein